MPKLSAPQLLVTGVAVIVLGVLSGWLIQAVFIEYVYRAHWFFGLGSVVSSALITIGAAMIGGAFVLAGLQRRPGAEPRPPAPGAPQPGPYPPAGAYPPAGVYPPPAGHPGAPPPHPPQHG